VTGFFAGLTYPFRGMVFVYLRHPGLVRLWIVPILITALVLAGILWGVWEYHDRWVATVWDEPAEPGFWGDVARFFHSALEVVVAIVAMVLGFFLAYLISSAIAAPFNSRLSEEVERLDNGRTGPPFQLWREVRLVLRGLALLTLMVSITLFLTVASWVSGAVFAPAGIVLSVVGYGVSALHAAIDAMDYTAERRGARFWYSYGFVCRHFRPSLGFGTGAFILVFVPFINLLLLPGVVAGGTLLYLDLESREAHARASARGEESESGGGRVVEAGS
jgi:CysZ protein